MNWYVIVLYFHLVGAVIFIGYVLYWVIMAISLHRVKSPSDVSSLMRTLAESRWPHVFVPFEWRITLPMLGLVICGFLLASGLALMASYGVSLLLGIKVVVFILVLAFQYLLLKDRRELYMATSFGLTLFILAISALLIRS